MVVQATGSGTGVIALSHFLIWLSLHRMAFVIVLGLLLWFGAYGFYFRQALGAWFNKGKPHSWSVDLSAKTSMSRGKQEY
jgi:hypothetical protein